ncbi:MAG: 50S ribosomal protein L9 [Planctomycetes bacterium]|nr:50S ribosomal protein L9 [Planctomycetota bacterium]
MKTRLILREDLPELGHVGDVIEVSVGYARNFLIPRGKAYPYSEDGMLRIEKARVEAEERRAAMAKEYEALAKRLEGVQLTFEERTGEEGKLFGAVTAKRIADGLAEQGLELAENQVRLPEPIRAVGEYEVPIHIHAELNTEIKVWVVAEATEEEEAEA